MPESPSRIRVSNGVVLAAPFEVFTPTTHPQECRKTLDGWFDPRHGELFHLPNPGK
jgi:hypothetical protein